MLAKRFLIIYGITAALSLAGWISAINGARSDIHYTGSLPEALLTVLVVPLAVLLPLVPFAAYRVITGQAGWRLLLRLPRLLGRVFHLAWVGIRTATPLVWGVLAFIALAFVRHSPGRRPQGSGGDHGYICDASDHNMEHCCDSVTVMSDGEVRPFS